MDEITYRKNILGRIFSDSRFSESKKEFFAFCPEGCNDKKRKLQVNVEKNLYRCWVCDQRGHVLNLLKRYGTKKDTSDYASTLKNLGFILDETSQVALSLPEDFELLPQNTPMGISALNYLKNNGITDKQIFLNKVGYCSLSEKILFPSFDENGRLNYYITRRLDDNSYKKYLDCEGASKNDIIFNEIYVDWSLSLTVVEGVKAYLRHFDVFNIVPLLGSEMPDRSKLMYDIVTKLKGHVNLCLDPDAHKKGLKIAERLSGYGVDVYIYYLERQPDELTSREILNSNYQKYTFDNLQIKIENLL